MFTGIEMSLLYRRVWAGIFDWLIGFITYFTLLWSIISLYPSNKEQFTKVTDPYSILIIIILVAFFPTYYSLSTLLFGSRSLGKLIFGMHLVNETFIHKHRDKRISTKKLISREFLKGFLISFFFGIPHFAGIGAILYYFTTNSLEDFIFWTDAEGKEKINRLSYALRILAATLIVLVYGALLFFFRNNIAAFFEAVI
jgi:hypothetical protein